MPERCTDESRVHPARPRETLCRTLAFDPLQSEIAKIIEAALGRLP